MSKIKTDATDRQLIEAVQKNKSEKAFTIIYNRYSNDIKNHLKYKTNNNSFLENAIDDIVNETFITLWENIVNEKYESQGYLKAYLLKISFFKFCKETKKQLPVSSDFKNEISDDENRNELLEILDGDVIDYQNIAEKALGTLNEICLKLIISKYYDKLSDEEIFNELKDQFQTVRNIRSRRSHCMDKLRESGNSLMKEINL